MRLSQQFLFVMSLGATLGSVGCHRPSSSARHQSEPIVYATWYDVPADSLARRRAGIAELTAASDRFKLGTLLRVTRLTNGKSVIVRITDRGLHSKKSRLDICKEAAAQLDMVSAGVARVKTEVLAMASPHE